MALTYFKRYRMELDLAGRDLTWVKSPGATVFSPGTSRCWSPTPR